MYGSSQPTAWHGLDELRPLVMRYLARRCRDEHEAEDLAQETLLRAARYRAPLADRGRLSSWLLRIAANVRRDHLRREGRVPRVGPEEEWLEEIEDPRPAPGTARLEGSVSLGNRTVDVEEALQHLSAALTRLVERDRAVLTAYYAGGGSTREAAAECGIHPALVKVRLFRARRRLERLVRQRASDVRARRRVLIA